MDGPKVPLLSGGPEKRTTEGEIISSEKGSLVENLCGNSPESGRLATYKAIDDKLLDSLAVDGVSREPLSKPNSLLTGKFTGKFANLSQQLQRKISL